MKAPNAFLLGGNGRPIPGKAGTLKGTTTGVSPNQGGGHAEEYFLMKLMAFADQFYLPSEIEIYISRIPCASTSMKWNFSFKGVHMSLPAGCGAKLYAVIKTLSMVNWYIAYGEGYTGQTQSSSLAWINRIDSLPNAEAVHISKFI